MSFADRLYSGFRRMTLMDARVEDLEKKIVRLDAIVDELDRRTFRLEMLVQMTTGVPLPPIPPRLVGK